MSKSKKYNNRLEIADFPDILTKADWIDLHKSLMAWGKRVAKRNKQRQLQPKDSPDLSLPPHYAGKDDFVDDIDTMEDN